MEYQLLFQDDLLIIATEGPACVQAYARILDDLERDERWRPGDKMLIDHRKLDGSQMTADDVRDLVRLMHEKSAIFGDGRRATVAPRDIEFGLTRMIHLLMETLDEQHVEAFRDFDEALAWLRTEG